MHSFRTRIGILIALALPASAAPVVSAAFGNVLVVAPTGGNFTAIQPAVDAAVDGDTILIKAGSYAGFSAIGKGINVVAAPGIPPIVVSGTVAVDALPAGKTFVVAGLSVTSASSTTEAFSFTNCQGAVRIERCTFAGKTGSVWNCNCFSACPTGGCGEDGARAGHITGCTNVVLSKCTILGGRGMDDPNFSPNGVAGSGADALTIQGSVAAIYDTTIIGGTGGSAYYIGGPGAHALPVSGSSLFLAKCSIHGGYGGDAFIYPSNGGSGLLAGTGSTVYNLGSSFHAGLGGQCYQGGGCGGLDGYAILGAVSTLPAAARTLTCPNPVKDRAPLSLSFAGTAGDRVVLNFSTLPEFSLNLPQNGISLVASPLLSRMDLGTIPAGGILNVQLMISDAVAPAGMAVNRYLQAVVSAPGGAIVRTQACNLVVLDKQF